MAEGPTGWRRLFGFPLVLGLLVGLVGGFGAGIVYVSMHRAATEANWTDLKYPGATDGSSSSGGGGGLRSEVPFIHQQMQVTTDSYDQVKQHYADRMGLVGMGASGGQSRQSLIGGETLTYVADDTRSDGSPRPAKVQAFAQRNASGSAVILISRADGEEHTHIVLYWMPRQ